MEVPFAHCYMTHGIIGLSSCSLKPRYRIILTLSRRAFRTSKCRIRTTASNIDKSPSIHQVKRYVSFWCRHSYINPPKKAFDFYYISSLSRHRLPNRCQIRSPMGYQIHGARSPRIVGRMNRICRLKQTLRLDYIFRNQFFFCLPALCLFHFSRHTNSKMCAYRRLIMQRRIVHVCFNCTFSSRNGHNFQLWSASKKVYLGIPSIYLQAHLAIIRFVLSIVWHNLAKKRS